MRHKIYTKEQIIKAAHSVIKESGFENFTARNIAKKMGGSTQPIYIHFKSMQDLKMEVVDSVQMSIDRKLAGSNPKNIQEQCLNYLHFAQKNPKIFRALFQESSGMGTYIYEKSLKEYKKDSLNTPELSLLTEEQQKKMHDSLWVAITGLALLDTSGIIKTTQDQKLVFINDIIQSTMGVVELEK